MCGCNKRSVDSRITPPSLPTPDPPRMVMRDPTPMKPYLDIKTYDIVTRDESLAAARDINRFVGSRESRGLKRYRNAIVAILSRATP